ncbi:MAG: 4-hydroxyphenylpyruvate dioxygenase [Hyphomicrobiales bacterium]|nr:MAG: 4-hydroxyphenylpyruvate dioxygenase [Hyphomicrobiales bacterium]
MGPFPHNAPPTVVSDSNPMGTDGFEFIEYAHPEPAKLADLFARLGFAQVARHRSKNVTLWRQGDINYVLNAEPDSFAARFAEQHGPCICAMGFRVVDAAHAMKRAVSLGATARSGPVGPMELAIPAIEGIGGSLLYFVDRYGDKGSIWDVDFVWTGEQNPAPAGAGFTYIDHLTHNVHRGNMDVWAGWYEKLFNFRELRFFDIEGKLTGLKSRAMTSPCGKIRIPINESTDDKSQIEEYLSEYRGEGIQHVALGTGDIYAATEQLAASGIAFMPPPPATYYDAVEARLPGHGEPLDGLKQHGILIDGTGATADGPAHLLLQIFSATLIGPIFFEFIQRKGDDGFGEGNFRALFESIEEDQIRRGVLAPDAA